MQAIAFWSRVSIAGDDDCWEWRGAVNNSGYGSAYYHGIKGAHRVAYALGVGEIPAGHHVCHHCDNPKCCNPRHLFSGSKLDNMADMRAKGRSASGDRNGMRRHPERRAIGERNGNSKLSAVTVQEIKQMHAVAALRGCDIASLYGISRQQVSRILLGQRWGACVGD
jgi:hypothetical protein